MKNRPFYTGENADVLSNEMKLFGKTDHLTLNIQLTVMQFVLVSASK